MLKAFDSKIDTISSNTLFHFTNSAENLISILSNEFRPHYCLENLTYLVEGSPKYFEFAIPMVCFCDLPLSLIKRHLTFYGEYGIGLSKDWGMQNGVSPILYSYTSSSFLRHVRNILEIFSIRLLMSKPKPEDPRLFYGLLSFLKPYEDRFWRRDQYIPKVRFYDEREWRFVPETFPKDPALLADPNYKDIPAFLSKDDFLNKGSLTKADQKLSRDIFRLEFVPNDIKYIIVSKESEIIQMIHSIRQIKGKYDNDQVDLLTSRIIAASQIIEDF